uniref:Uncharacterized protein n=1 Tax=Trichogramma kaykai TaxID=54128 RepID=A0ABD2WK86_9HYME
MSLHALLRIKLKFVTTSVVIVLHADVVVVGPRPPPPPPDSSGRVRLLLLSSSSNWLVLFKREDREYAYGTIIPPRTPRYRCSALTCGSGAEDVHYYGCKQNIRNIENQSPKLFIFLEYYKIRHQVYNLEINDS